MKIKNKIKAIIPSLILMTAILTGCVSFTPPEPPSLPSEPSSMQPEQSEQSKQPEHSSPAIKPVENLPNQVPDQDQTASVGQTVQTLESSVNPAENVHSKSQEHQEEIQNIINAVAEKYHAVGLQAAVIKHGNLIGSYVYGWATRDSEPMTPEHKIRAASLTKIAIGMAALRLQEAGIINLDQSIGDYWGVTMRNPNYPDIPISVRSLLSHTSSIRVFDWEVSRSYQNVKTLLQSDQGYSRLKPGDINSWGYNNYAFGVLGQTLELASGKSMDEIMDLYFWSAMDIQSAFESGSIPNTDLLATLYDENQQIFNSKKTLLQNTRPDSLGATGDNFSGGMTISAQDLAKMTELLIHQGDYHGSQLLQPKSVDIMEQCCSDTPLSDGSYQAYPLRLRKQIYGRERLYYHTGSGYGVHNWLSFDPDTGDGVIILTTGASGDQDSYNIYSVCSEIGQKIYQLLAEN